MDTRLYKLAERRCDGSWHWSVPGFGNGVDYDPNPESFGSFRWTRTLSWPCRDPGDGSEFIRRVDLDRHRRLAKAEIRALIAACKAKARKDRKLRRLAAMYGGGPP